jgi:hypothetical protein
MIGHPILEPGADTSRTRRCDAGRLVADRALLERYLQRRDPVARNALVERSLPLARGLARRYQRTGEPFYELFQVACLGLVKAIDRFDLHRDVAFSVGEAAKTTSADRGRASTGAQRAGLGDERLTVRSRVPPASAPVKTGVSSEDADGPTGLDLGVGV